MALLLECLKKMYTYTSSLWEKKRNYLEKKKWILCTYYYDSWNQTSRAISAGHLASSKDKREVGQVCGRNPTSSLTWGQEWVSLQGLRLAIVVGPKESFELHLRASCGKQKKKNLIPPWYWYWSWKDNNKTLEKKTNKNKKRDHCASFAPKQLTCPLGDKALRDHPTENFVI